MAVTPRWWVTPRGRSEMSPHLDTLLCERYPPLFTQRHLPVTQTTMCWGFSCGDGWFALIDQLCADLQACVDAGRIRQPVAVQVKEKFAELRFYLSNTSEVAERPVEDATHRSRTICETCGQPGVLRVSNHWYRTRCDAHAEPGSTVVPPEDD